MKRTDEHRRRRDLDATRGEPGPNVVVVEQRRRRPRVDLARLTATRTAIPRVTATFGKSMASASIITDKSLGETTGAAQPVDQSSARLSGRL